LLYKIVEKACVEEVEEEEEEGVEEEVEEAIVEQKGHQGIQVPHQYHHHHGIFFFDTFYLCSTWK